MAPTKFRTLSDYPEFVARAAKIGTLKTERADEERLLGVARTKLSRYASGSTPARRAIEAEAAQLIGDDITDTTSEASLRAEVVRRERQVAVLTEAISQLERRHEAERNRLTAEIVAPFIPRYQKAVAEGAALAVEAQRKIEAAERIRLEADAAAGGSTTGYLRPMGLPGFGRLTERHDGLNLFLGECREFGFDAPEPPELLEAERRAEAQAAADRKRRAEDAKRELAIVEARQRATEAKRKARAAAWTGDDPLPAA